MDGDFIIVDGEIREGAVLCGDPSRAFGPDFIYRKIHTLGHRPLHMAAQFRFLDESCRILYGKGCGTTERVLSDEISALLAANRYPETSVLCGVWFINENEGESLRRVITVIKMMLYKGYVLWHSQADTVLTPYELPLFSHKTAVSLAMHNYSISYAARQNAVPLGENFSGIITGMGEDPVFAVAGSEVLTSPFDSGVPDSTERRIGIEAARKAGYIVLEQNVESAVTGEYDEMFTVTPQGIMSFRRCGDRVYPNTSARRIAEAMSAMTAHNLSMP